MGQVLTRAEVARRIRMLPSELQGEAARLALQLYGPAEVSSGPRSPTIDASMPRFGSWLKAARPEKRWDYPHFVAMQDVLDKGTRGEIKRAYFSVSVRHGKTEHNSVSYSAYRIEHDPRTRFLLATHSQKMAQKISRQIRTLVRLRGVELSKDRDSASEWETTQGGGVRAVSNGEGVASLNADVIIIDDPLGGRAEAESFAMRERVWDWITNDLLARCEPHTFVSFTMSRWHVDDPAGRLLERQASSWHVLDLPGRAEENDFLGRKPGEVLWPEMRGEEWHRQARIDMQEYGYASLVQGRPRPREGGMFKWDWWKELEAVPAVGPMVRYWDLAGTQPKGGSHDPDYSAGALLCRMQDQRTAIVDVERFRLSIAARDARLEQICRQDLQKYRGRIRWWIETEAGIAGQERTAVIVRRLQALGMPVYTEHPTGKKELRAEPLASAAEAQNVLLCPGEWRDPFRLEAADFPNGKHDDQIDGAAGAFSKLSEPARTVTVQTLRM